MVPKLLAASILAAVFMQAAFAQQYRWVDANGKVQYGDVPPPGVDAKRLKPPPAPPPTSSKDAQRTQNEKETAFRNRQQQSRKAQDQEEQKRVADSGKQQNCEQAQAELRTLDSGVRIARIDATGERYYLDDAAIEKEKASARKAVEAWCGGSR